MHPGTSRKRLKVHGTPQERRLQSADDTRCRPQQREMDVSRKTHPSRPCLPCNPCHYCDMDKAYRSELGAKHYELSHARGEGTKVVYNCPQPAWHWDYRTRDEFYAIPSSFRYMELHRIWQLKDLIGCELQLATRSLLDEVDYHRQRG